LNSDRIEAIPEGFNGAAFFFGFLWLLYKRLWIPAIVAFWVIAVLASLLGNSDSINLFFASLAVHGVIGQFGNDIRAGMLEQKGYKHVSTIDAVSEVEAITKFINAGSQNRA